MLFGPFSFFCLLSAAFFALCSLRCSVSSLFHFFVLLSFCSFLALLWFFAVCLPDLSFSVPVSAGYGLFIAFKPVLL